VPSGAFYQWDGSSQATGTFLAPLNPGYYNDPTTLTAARSEAQAYVLAQTLGLYSTGDYSYNWGGRQEKWRKRSAKPEAHCNTMEGIWTGGRIFLAPFRGVSKWYQAQSAAVFEWVYNTKRFTGEFVRALLGLRVVTNPGT